MEQYRLHREGKLYLQWLKITQTSEDGTVQGEEEELIDKNLEVEPEQFILNWKYKDVNKKLTYDIKKCIGCSLC